MKIGDFKVESGYKLAEALMSKKEKPTAIFAVTDNIAVGAIEYLNEKGYKIPGDVAIIGMGDSKISSFTSPKLTTIHYYYKTSGVVAAKTILELLNEGVQSSRNKLIKEKLSYSLIERNSM